MAEWKGHKNPFLNELVIDNISKYLSLKELKVCRGLNHLWKKTTSKTFLKLCPPLRLILFVSNEDYVIGSDWQLMTIPLFMKIYSHPNHPHPYAQLLRQYRNFSVSGWDEECIPIFYNFMTVVGSQMTSLEFSYAEVLRSTQDLMDLVSSKYTPKLEKLFLNSLEKIRNYQQSDSLTVPIDVKENKHFRRLSVAYSPTNIRRSDVLSRYPKLNTLQLEGFPADVLEEIATGLVTIRKADEEKLKLTELGILGVRRTGYGAIADEEMEARWHRILDLLKKANLPLEKITLDDRTSVISYALIHHYAANLKYLTFKNYMPQPFPLMKALEEITVECSPDLTFLTKAPNLKFLCFKLDSWHVLPIRFPNSTPKPLLSLTKLDCGIWIEWNVTEMQHLLLWMPNIQNLRMHMNNTTFSWICQHFPNLKKLTVFGDDLDDSGVVGDIDGTLAVAERSRPNITYLKGLEKFKMGNKAVLNKGLTDKSVFHGFSLMPKLSNLDINVKSVFSGATMRALNRGIKNVKVCVASKYE